MWKLAAVLYPIAATTLAGVAVLIGLVLPELGLDTMAGMSQLGLGGLAAGLPVAVALAAAMTPRRRGGRAAA